MTGASILWRRLDAPGHDACRLDASGSGWATHGTAVYREATDVACLTYRVSCDSAWLSQRGEVRGWLGARSVELSVVRTPAGSWSLNGESVRGLEHCVDLDLGFTPATNLLQLRRAALAIGQAADVPVAWLDVAAGTLDLLEQRYERRGETTYWYEAPRFDYAATLEVSPTGFIVAYPPLWEAEL